MISLPHEPGAADSVKAKILLVDDRVANLTALQAVLDSLHHELVSVGSGAEALKAVATQDFAVILLDVQMPLMNGFETATRMKEIERARHVPIIFVTAIDYDDAHVKMAYKGGAVDFIRKPFDIDILRAKVSVFVDLYCAKEQVRRDQVKLREAERVNLLESEQKARAEADRLAATLREADRLKEEFVATLGNELRPPLNAILGWTRMLRDGSVREAQRGRALETVERNAGAQLELIEEMLDITRITSGTLSITLTTVDLVDVIEQAIQQVRPVAAEKNVALHAALERDVAPMPGDAERLGQIVRTLVGNAVKFTPSGGVVTVCLCNEGAQVEIAIEDTGIGIDPDALPKLFGRFAWKDVGTPRLQGGLGLGLAVVKHLVELHEGTIHAESPGLGQGSRFVVRLPARGPTAHVEDVSP